MSDQILPVIDMDILQEKANEAAMKGAIAVINDFYTGYNSPMKKLIEDSLKAIQLDSYKIALPSVLAEINAGLVAQIDLIANEAIAKSFVPMVGRFLAGVPKEILLSDVLNKFVDVCSNHGEVDRDDFECSIEKYITDCWKVKLSYQESMYEIILHKVYRFTSDPGPERWQLLGLPYNGEKHKPTMKLSIDGVSLEMPFTKEILSDSFMSYLAQTIICKSEIEMDCRDFKWSYED